MRTTHRDQGQMFCEERVYKARDQYLQAPDHDDYEFQPGKLHMQLVPAQL